MKAKAELISDGLEASSLIDAAVPNRCHLGIKPETSSDVESHEDIKALDRALIQGRRGTIDKRIVAAFTGRYECGAGTNRILHIEHVDNLLCLEQHGGVSGTGCSSAPSSSKQAVPLVSRRRRGTGSSA